MTVDPKFADNSFDAKVQPSRSMHHIAMHVITFHACIPGLHFATFSFQRGAKGSWGERANKDLIVTQGKRFKHEKTKKKRGSYKGGSIDASQVCSVKFDSDSD